MDEGLTAVERVVAALIRREVRTMAPIRDAITGAPCGNVGCLEAVFGGTAPAGDAPPR